MTKNSNISKEAKFMMGVIGAIVGLILILILAFTSIYKVPAGYNGVVYSMSGGVQQEVKGQGWHVVYPNQKVYDYPISTEMVEIEIEGGTNDGKTVKLDIQYAFHMESEMLPQIFTKFRGRSASEISKAYINQQIRDQSQLQTRINSVLGVYSQNTTTIISNIREKLAEILLEDGIVLERFTISDVTPDEATILTLQAISDAQNRGELLKREEQNKEQEAINNLIQAEGVKKVEIVQAEAQAERQIIDAESKAEANRLLTQSLSPEIINYEWIKQWSGELPTHMLGEDAGIMLGK